MNRPMTLLCSVFRARLVLGTLLHSRMYAGSSAPGELETPSLATASGPIQ
jgi:hypothetical protein